MKKHYLLLLCLLSAAFAQSQIINFPDVKFKAKLLTSSTSSSLAKNAANANIKIDANNDGEIQVSEALQVAKLNFSESVVANKFTDMTGLEYFSTLDYLNITQESITSFSVNGLVNLKLLGITSTALASIDLNSPTALTNITLFSNKLVTLTVPSIPTLTNLIVFDTNTLTTINLSAATSLTDIKISGNPQLTNVNVSGLPLVSSMQIKICPALTSLNLSGMTSLYVLNCTENALLSSINLTGCNALKIVDLSSCNFTVIPSTTPTTITSLTISGNVLNTLDITGFPDLETISARNCNLSSFNYAGLDNLGFISLTSNHLTALDFSGTNINSIYVYGNDLTSLQVSNMPLLEVLDFDNNPIANIDLTGLPNLGTLSASSTLLTSIDTSLLPLNINTIQLDNTQITSFHCQGFNNLISLSLTHNSMLTSVVVENCNMNNAQIYFCPQLNNLVLTNVQVYDLFVNDCALTTLDLSSCGVNSSYFSVDMEHNPLISMNLKNGAHESFFSQYPLPTLEYVCCDAADVAEFTTFFGSNVAVNSFCTFTPGGSFYTLHGNTKFDNNNNGCDAADAFIANAALDITNGTTTGTIIGNASGHYEIPVQAGTQTITPSLEMPAYFTVSPASYVVTLPVTPVPGDLDFCVSANGMHNDVEVMVIPNGAPVPGFDFECTIVYRNKGNQAASGTVQLAYDDAIQDYINAQPTPSTSATGNLSWDFVNLLPFETRTIHVKFNMNTPTETPPLTMNDALFYTASLNGTPADETPDDNTFTLAQNVVNSYDPNDKTCLEGTQIDPFLAGTYVHYMIRFENNGTANARNILVTDVIDTTKFDISTLVALNGSHDFTTRITGNTVRFMFNDINLPFDDANNDGYVLFKIKTNQALMLGDTFSNTASIYFDYNSAIVTNTATTTLTNLGTPDFPFENYFTIYPNPAKDVLNIKAKADVSLKNIEVYNTLGQLVLAVPNANRIEKIDVSNLTVGSYFIKITSDKGSSNAKFLKK